MKTRGTLGSLDKPAHIFCCGEEIYKIPAGKELLMSGHNNTGSVRTSITCQRCLKLIVLCLVDEAA